MLGLLRNNNLQDFSPKNVTFRSGFMLLFTNLKFCCMKKQFLKAIPVGVLLLLAVLLVSCEKNQLGEEAQDKTVKNPDLALKAAAADVQGRNLASNCFQCHGTNGYAGELKIAGKSASGIISEFREMKTKPVGENIMNVHARGYTDAEVKLIADFISKQ